jgi:citrate/tricarballylate utilization protein
MAISLGRFLRDTAGAALPPAQDGALWQGLRDAFSLRYLHGSGEDCTIAENVRTPWRRWLHHAMAGGFVLCFASTSVATFYHFMLGLEAPYPLRSAPVVLGALGGVGLLCGTVGLGWLRTRREPLAIDRQQQSLDLGLLFALASIALTGLALLWLRDTPSMRPLLLAHLALVLAFFLMLPYGKLVHGLYRAAALVRHAHETRAEHGG